MLHVKRTVEVIQGKVTCAVQVWMITGDKQETAINIAISCKLVRNPGSLLICNESSPEAAEKRLQELAHTLQRQYEPVKHHNPTPFAGPCPPSPSDEQAAMRLPLGYGCTGGLWRIPAGHGCAQSCCTGGGAKYDKEV